MTKNFYNRIMFCVLATIAFFAISGFLMELGYGTFFCILYFGSLLNSVRIKLFNMCSSSFNNTKDKAENNGESESIQESSEAEPCEASAVTRMAAANNLQQATETPEVIKEAESEFSKENTPEDAEILEEMALPEEDMVDDL